jgi:hypothetical protein
LVFLLNCGSDFLFIHHFPLPSTGLVTGLVG